MLGSNIRMLREKRELTQEALAKMVGCSQSNISKYESDSLGIDAAMLLDLARALECTVDELFVMKNE